MPAFHAGAGNVGSMTAHSASRVYDGFRGTRALRLMPSGQHRQGTRLVSWDRAAPDGSLICMLPAALTNPANAYGHRLRDVNAGLLGACW